MERIMSNRIDLKEVGHSLKMTQVLVHFGIHSFLAPRQCRL